MKNRYPFNFSRVGIKVLSFLVILSSLLAGCRLPWGTSPDETIETGQIPEKIQPTSTPEPRNDLPPALVEVSPLPNSVIALAQPISLYFSQAMDKASVEAAIRFEPSVSGRFTWEGDRKVMFTPDQALLPGSSLHLGVDTNAQGANAKRLQQAIEINYNAASKLEVIQVVPSEKAVDVDPESVIFVTFNQPVVPLGGEDAAQPAFSLSPDALGIGRWLNTSTYIFTPQTSLDGGTQYVISLNESLTSTFGSGFDTSEKLRYRFTTAEPEVINLLPANDEKLSLDGPIEVHFNIRMDPGSVAEHFSLVDSTGEDMPGYMAWDEDFQVVKFTPNTTLERNQTYTIRIGEEAQSMGGLSIGNNYVVSRTTYPMLSLDSNALPTFFSYYGGYGQYEIHFTAPINEDEIREFINVEPEVSSLAVYASREKIIFVSGYFDPETEYTVTLQGGLEDRWGGQLGGNIVNTFFTPPADPSLNLVTGQTYTNLAFIPADVSEIALQATNINTVYLDVAPITMDDLMTVLHPDNYNYRQVYLPENLETTEHRLVLTRNVNEVVRVPLVYDGKPLTPGIYFLAVSTPDIEPDDYQHYQKYFFIVSENNLVMKVAPGEVFVWGTHLTDYAPLVGAPVSIYTTEGQLVTEGLMDADGIFTSEIPQSDEPYINYFGVVGEAGQDEFAFTISSWNQDYTLYENGIDVVTQPQRLETYLYTDRPIYRPGDEVFFKGAVFSRENGLPIHANIDGVTLTVTGDPGMVGIPTILLSQNVVLSSYGTFEGSVVLPEGATTGIYSINVAYDEKLIDSLNFDVAAYRKPQIEVDIELSRREILAGEDLSVEVQVDTYFGMPASEQAVYWQLFQKEVHFDLPGYVVGPQSKDWLMPPIPGGTPIGSRVSSGEGMTGEDGGFSFDLTAADFDFQDISAGSTQEFTLEVSVAEESGFNVSNRAQILSHPETFYIGVQPEAYFGVAEQPISFSILTVDRNKKVFGDLALDVAFEKIEWRYEKVGDPGRPYQYVPVTTPVSSASPITGADGQARLSFTPPDPGTYQLRATSGDAVTEVIIWVGGAGTAAWPNQRHNQIKMTTDAEDYQPGQIAQIFFPNPFLEGAKALVTIERGKVMDRQILNIEGTGHTLSIPILDESIPNVYVSVMLLGKNQAGLPDYRQGTIALTVPPLSKALTVDVSLDPKITEPGDVVTANLMITDSNGGPVQGEFSIAVVDKSVLALMPPNSIPIIDAFYREQPLSVQTSYSLESFAVGLLVSDMDLGLGGGGDGLEPAVLREDFPDTALWQGTLITGRDGTGRIEIPLPDSLTTWVVLVRGLTADYLVGEAQAEIVTQKELMIQPVTPRFLVDGDVVELGADVYNNTTQEMMVDVSLHAIGYTLSDQTTQSQLVEIPAGDSAHISWFGTVESVESVNLVFQADAGDLIDASAPLWGELQVKRYAMPYTLSTAGYLQEAGQRLELVSLPTSVDPSSGELTVVLNPSLTSTLVESLEAMKDRTYNDTVTILSRLLANLNAYLAIKNLGIESPQLQANLQSEVKESIKKLLETQNFDGGWSWWGEILFDEQGSDPFITAYVLIGLEQAQQAGLQVGEGFVIQAQDFLSKHLIAPRNNTQGWRLDRLAFYIYAMRNAEVNLEPINSGLFTRRSELSSWAKALLSLTLHDLNESDERIQILLNDLENDAVRSATGVYWQTANHTWMNPGTPAFNTSLVLLAFAQLDPASASLIPALQYLMVNRSPENLGASALESAWILAAITAVLKGTGDYQADFDYLARLNDMLIAEGEGSGTAALTAVEASVAMGELYPDSPNPLVIERGEGAGTLYYRADLKAYQSAASSEPINKGISIQRTYYIAGQDCLNESECEPIEGFTLSKGEASQIIRVALTLTVSHDMVNLLVEDFIPAGTEIINRRLQTTQTFPENILPLYDPRNPFDDGWGWWYFSDPQIYDDHLLWKTEFLPAGTYTLTYDLYPFQRGSFQVLPAHAWQYYYPEIMGTSGGDLFTID
jgi:uncharacterized protein YfaS (alpha-2-macroglobulin family)